MKKTLVKITFVLEVAKDQLIEKAKKKPVKFTIGLGGIAYLIYHGSQIVNISLF